jgi:hypothetical protein
VKKNRLGNRQSGEKQTSSMESDEIQKKKNNGTVDVLRQSKEPSASMSASNNSINNHVPAIADQMDHVLELLSQRVQGRATNEDVESAVNNILHSMGTTTSTSLQQRTLTTRPPIDQPPLIQQDTGNYDSDDDDNENYMTQDAKPAASQNGEPSSRGTKRKLEENPANGDASESLDADHANGSSKTFCEKIQTDAEYDEAIGQIPMGWEAAKMMTTFGDGPRPQPTALALALLGTRQALQMAIMDARKIRRRLQQDFQMAEITVDPSAQKRQNDKKTKAKKKNAKQQQQNDNPGEFAAVGESTAAFANNESVNNNPPKQHDHQVQAADPSMVFRALAGGTDKLSMDQKCGFHMEELTHLFPEEMRAYQRWTEMHEEYSEKKGEQENLKEKVSTGQDDIVIDDEEVSKSPLSTPSTPLHTAVQEPDGGHLKERAAHFDFRTDRMKKDWYMEYAKVRQGSFLPSAMRVRRTQAEKEWDEIRKKKRGRHFSGSWESMSGRSVRFLHWLGFDPPNLYPPDEEVTHALAFLAYDRLGRIVEKAIFLRNLEKEKQVKGGEQEEDKEVPADTTITGPLWELPEGEQLTEEDIQRALEDPDVKPATLFKAEDSADRQTNIQLYFGPGWEDRLELEMEE